MIRWLVRGVLALVLLVAGLAAAMPWLTEPALRAALHHAGVSDVAFASARLRLGSLDIRGLEIGDPPAHQVEHVTVRFDPVDLLAGEIERVEIERPRLRARLGADGVEIPGLERAPAGNGAGVPAVPLPRRVVVDDAELRLELAGGAARVPFSARIAPGDGRAEVDLTVADARLDTERGRLVANLELNGRLPLGGAPDLADLTAKGRLRIDAQDLALPGHASGIGGGGELAFDIADGAIDAQSEELEVAVAALASGFVGADGPLPLPWQIRLASSEEPLRLALEPGEAGFLASLDGRAALENALPDVRAVVSLRLDLADDLAIRRVAPTTATVTVSDLTVNGFDLADGRLEVELAGAPTSLTGRGRVELAGSGTPVPGFEIEGASLQQDLELEAGGDGLVLRAASEGALRLTELAWQERVRGGPFTAHLRAADAPLLRIEPGAGGEPPAWRHAAIIAVDAFTAETDLAGAPTPLSGRIDRLEVALAGDGTGLADGRIRLADGGLRLPDRAVRLDGIDAEVALDRGGLAAGAAIPVSIGEIRHAGDPAWFRPLALEGTLRPGDDTLDFTARLTASGGAATLSVEGVHDLARGTGGAAVDLAPVTFTPGGLQPVQLAPILGRQIRGVTGRVSLNGGASWTTTDAGGQVALLVEELGLTAGPVSFEKINGLVRLIEVWPPATPAPQQLAIGEIDLGLPLTNGLVTFEVRPDPALAVEALRFDWAGGTLRAEPFTLRSAAPELTVVLAAESLDLAQIFEQVRLEGLTGEGVIDGTLPIRLQGREAVVEGGELAARGPGWLRYRPGDGPAAFAAGGESMELLLQALENFRYEDLRITLDGRTDAEMTIGLHLEGANPGLYDGYPIEFNLNLEGELANVLRSGLSGYRIPDLIRERMERFRQ